MRALAGGSSVDAAQLVGISERTRARRLRSALGKTPLSNFQDLRLEGAVHLLRTSGASMDRFAAKVGHSDGVTLRLLLRRRRGRSARDPRSQR